MALRRPHRFSLMFFEPVRFDITRHQSRFSTGSHGWDYDDSCLSLVSLVSPEHLVHVHLGFDIYESTPVTKNWNVSSPATYPNNLFNNLLCSRTAFCDLDLIQPWPWSSHDHEPWTINRWIVYQWIINELIDKLIGKISEVFYFWAIFMEIRLNNRLKSSRELFWSVLV